MSLKVSKVYKVQGMNCTSCALNIEWALEDVGIKAKCNYAKAELETESTDEKKIREVIAKEGYQILPGKPLR